MRVLIRTDASSTIGSGHVARCMTLANVLRGQGAQVVFVCRQLPGHLLARLEVQGFSTYALPRRYPGELDDSDIECPLPWQADITAMAGALLAESPFDWVIVDHYGLASEWERAARQWAPRVAAIDDLANRAHDADLLLDQNLTADTQAYRPLIRPECRTLLGPHFALLRDEFRREPIEIQENAKRVIVNFGGFDVTAQTHKAMLALADFTDLEVDFVAGIDNPAWAAMQTLAEARPGWRLLTQVSDFAQLMAQADLFIGAGGGTSWERAALGLPTICLAVAANQQTNAGLLARGGAHLYLGRSEQVSVEQLARAVHVVLDNQGLRHSFAHHSRSLVDGNGAQRVAAALSEDHVHD